MIDNYKDIIYSSRIIPNYKKMCELLEEEETTGNAKKAQLKEWQRYFDYDKVGQKFLITSMYDYPLPKNDGRAYGVNAIYVKHIELILTYILSKTTGYKCTLTKRELYNSLGMVNQRYDKYKDASIEALKEINSELTKYDKNHFYQRTGFFLDKILFSALNSMKSRCLIKFFEQYNIVETTEINDKKMKIERLANHNEISNLLNTEKEVLKSMGMLNMRHVFLKFKSKEFYSKVNNLLFDKYGWDYCYKDYLIIYAQPHMADEIPIIQREIKTLLNGQIVNAINIDSKNRIDKNALEHKSYDDALLSLFGDEYEDTAKNLKKPFDLKWNYQEIQEFLADYLIKIDEPLIENNAN